ncbi:hypothetical protein UO65_2780 [Actinokineospora spheciospongiae]|uniref:Nudix hydrolase domain-containing protein n=1 Tax=Actinokineospora spheciospongiae TaxID=909613 RepID=W7IZG9_9PSEU|nr:NUDIX domain-containing protein [Actinokineospora spheciospongiae]EWC61956.1 hypothetical protein UO65_2780 [Actinokineospora spheciospongiae]
MTVMENALATAVLVVDDAGLVLMVDRGGRLELPTGAARTGETVVAAAARAVLAQTGVVVAGASLVGLDSAGEFAVVLRARPVDGTSPTGPSGWSRSGSGNSRWRRACRSGWSAGSTKPDCRTCGSGGRHPARRDGPTRARLELHRASARGRGRHDAQTRQTTKVNMSVQSASTTSTVGWPTKRGFLDKPQDTSTLLSDLPQPNMGVGNWAACREVLDE